MIAAHAHVDTGHKKGNVVVTVASDAKSGRNAGKGVILGDKAHA
jgi:hypothetical protein